MSFRTSSSSYRDLAEAISSRSRTSESNINGNPIAESGGVLEVVSTASKCNFDSEVSDGNKIDDEATLQKHSWRRRAELLKASRSVSKTNNTESFLAAEQYKAAEAPSFGVTPNDMNTRKNNAGKKSVRGFEEKQDVNGREVHFIGELSGAVVGRNNFAVSCQWRIEFGKNWSHVDGETSGQTQYCTTNFDSRHSFNDTNCCWNHPLDVHFIGRSSHLQEGWPRIILQIWEIDPYDRILPVGYGFLHLPTSSTPGTYQLKVPCWRPKGTYLEEIKAFFLGPKPQLSDDLCLFGRAWEDRQKLVTIPCVQVSNTNIIFLSFFLLL